VSKFSAFKEETATREIGFNLVPEVNSFNSIFDIKPLNEEESAKIQQLLSENWPFDAFDKEQLQKDVRQLQQLTSEIRSIGRQGVLLAGERVLQAKELLKQYNDSTFTKWLKTAFSVRSSGYNALSYFMLYKNLDGNDLKEQFKKIPMRAAYVLSSRDGSIDVKAEIIRQHGNLSHQALITAIREKLPKSVGDKRVKTKSTTELIADLRKAVTNLEKRKDELGDAEKASLDVFRNELDSTFSR